MLSTATLFSSNQKPTFPRENPKNNSLKILCGQILKRLFFWFLLEKMEKDCFGGNNQLFPRKKMVLVRKTNFFLFGKTKKQNKNIFWETLRPDSKKMVFWFSLGKGGFPAQNHLFPGKKLVFLPKTIFFPGKSWFSFPKPSFFQTKSWFSCPKPAFF